MRLFLLTLFFTVSCSAALITTGPNSGNLVITDSQGNPVDPGTLVHVGSFNNIGIFGDLLLNNPFASTGLGNSFFPTPLPPLIPPFTFNPPPLPTPPILPTQGSGFLTEFQGITEIVSLDDFSGFDPSLDWQRFFVEASPSLSNGEAQKFQELYNFGHYYVSLPTFVVENHDRTTPFTLTLRSIPEPSSALLLALAAPILLRRRR